MKEDEPEWVEVASVGNDEEAALIAGFLISQGITCEVEGPAGGSPWPENLGAFGMSRVMVPPEDAAEARHLLESRKRESAREAQEESDTGEE
ncbi:MAG TPA: DUF2007 domain-containing protein [Thermoanaerobaculia bacterium]|nr:DUF2007 domain-containing protein [Thermoanaerobaculia bacterium]